LAEGITSRLLPIPRLRSRWRATNAPRLNKIAKSRSPLADLADKIFVQCDLDHAAIG
jgi:hypothetical protein